MKLGLCAGYEKAQILKECGFDYFEYNLVSLYGLSQSEFMEAERTVERIGFYAETMGIMLPPHMRIVGHKVDLHVVRDYLDVVLDRAVPLGCKMVSFGSSHSRNMPGGFNDRGLAYSQITAFLIMASEMLDKRGMTLVIEPCPVHENNILTFISEAYYMMKRVSRPNVGIMADTYSMQLGFEGLDQIFIHEEDIKHLHFSAPNRQFPIPGDGYDYSDFFNLIARMGYDRTITVEAFHPDNFYEGARGVYRLLEDGLLKARANRREKICEKLAL